LKDISGNYFFAILIGFVSFITAGASNPMVYYVWFWSIAFTSYTIKIVEIK
jgi:hypothetical protein